MSRLACPGGPRARLEEPLRLRVEDDHPAFAIDDDDRVGCGFEETSKPRLDLLPCGRIPDDADDQSPLLGLQRAQADLDGELAAVLTAPGERRPPWDGSGARENSRGVPGMVLAEPPGNQSLIGMESNS